MNVVDVGKVRTAVLDIVVDAVPPGTNVMRYPPDDYTDAPLIYIDLAGIAGSFDVSGGTTLRFPIVVVSTRTDHENSLDTLEALSAAVWAAFGNGKSVEVPPGMRGLCRTADPEQQTSADTTWPAMRFAVDVEVGLVC